MDEKTLSLFIGAHAKYYLRKWMAVDYGGRANTWNIAALFFSYFWLAYRKMFAYCAMFIFLCSIILLFALIVEASLTTIAMIMLLFPMLIGLFGNRMYRYYIENKIIKIYELNISDEGMQKLIIEQGGTDMGAVIILVFIIAGLLYAILLLCNLVPDYLLPMDILKALIP